jgi:hypothetical protein
MIFGDYREDGFLPVMVMYDGSPDRTAQLADEYGLTYPILSDASGEVFGRFNQEQSTPQSDFIAEGMTVHTVDVIWYPALIEEVLYGE